MATVQLQKYHTVFQKNLSDVVKGIRSHKKNEREYVQKCIAESRDELRQTYTLYRLLNFIEVYEKDNNYLEIQK